MSLMTKHEVATLALRLSGLYALLHLLMKLGMIPLYVSMTLQGFQSGSGTQGLLVVVIELIPPFLLGCVGYVLMKHAGGLAHRFFPEMGDGDANTPVSARHIQAIAFSVVGLALVALALPHLSQTVAILMAKHDRVRWSALVAPGVRLGVGLVLFFGGAGLAEIWHRLYRAGCRFRTWRLEPVEEEPGDGGEAGPPAQP